MFSAIISSDAINTDEQHGDEVPYVPPQNIPVGSIPVPIDKADSETDQLLDPHQRMKVQTVSLKDAERIPYEPPRTIVYSDEGSAASDFGNHKPIYAEQADVISSIESR